MKNCLQNSWKDVFFFVNYTFACYNKLEWRKNQWTILLEADMEYEFYLGF